VPGGEPARASQERWLRARGYLNKHRSELTAAAQELYPAAWRVAGTPLLALPHWIPAAPVPLGQVTLSWRPDAAPGALTGLEPESESARPLRQDGTRYPSYAEALGELSRPRLLENRVCYRLLGASAGPPGTHLTFGAGRYFDMINLCEATAHELAAATLDGRVRASRRAPAARLPLRSLIGDPTDFRRRPVMAAVSALILRRCGIQDEIRNEPWMILHWRDPSKVATGGGLYQVAPVGMFQPSHDAGWNHANDFSLWRTFVRELSEELLGSGEDYGSDATPIDYGRWPLYAELTAARQSGALRVYWLGLGVDPLTLVADMLAVAVFDAPLFDSLIATGARGNDEGHTDGFPFTAATIDRFTREEAMQPAGAALLRTAWHHRGTLLPP